MEHSPVVVQTPAPKHIHRDSNTAETVRVVSKSGGLYVSYTTLTLHLSPLIAPTHVAPKNNMDHPISTAAVPTVVGKVPWGPAGTPSPVGKVRRGALSSPLHARPARIGKVHGARIS